MITNEPAADPRFRWLDRWLEPRWRALLTWVAVAALTGALLEEWGNSAIGATEEFLREHISPHLPFSLPAALQSNPLLPSLAFVLYWFHPIALRLNPMRTLIWLIASAILGTAILMVSFKFISFRLGTALFFGCLAGLPGLAVIGQRTRPWLTLLGGALAAAFIWPFEMGEGEVIFALMGSNFIFPAKTPMKTLPLIAGLILVCHFELQSAPPEPEKTQPAAPAKPYLRFMAYVGDTTRPDDMRFQLNTPVSRLRRESSFVKLGEIVLGTKFKLTKFQFKTRRNSKGGADDVSEVTLEHIDTKEETVLVLGER